MYIFIPASNFMSDNVPVIERLSVNTFVGSFITNFSAFGIQEIRYGYRPSDHRCMTQ